MAGIDKIYVNSYYEHEELLKWSLIYYPKLLRYFYDIHETWETWEKTKANRISHYIEIAKRDMDKIDPLFDKDKEITEIMFEEYIERLKAHYKATVDYDCPQEQAEWEVTTIIDSARKTYDDWEDDYQTAITNTPLKVDRYLKWHCPLPFVREYLHKQCGVNPKLEWLYKLFWKGKKLFN